MKISSEQPSINWVYVGLVAVIGTATLAFISGAITWQVFSQWSQGKAVTGGWTWWNVLLVDVLCAAGITALYRKIYCDAHIRIDEAGLFRPEMFGEQTITWSEVTKVEIFNGVGYHVFAGKRKIVVSPYAYRHPEEVVESLRKHLEHLD